MSSSVENQAHVPVLLEPILEQLQLIAEPKWGLDVTFGRGGHTLAMLKSAEGIQMLAVDRDAEAVNYGNEQFADLIAQQRLKIVHADFVSFLKDYEGPSFDFILADLGVSSPQLDQAERGFSFYHDGPLDMRMNLHGETTAATLVNQLSEEELIELFQNLGEVRRPHRVVRAIVHDRMNSPFERTRQLAEMIERVDGWRKKGSHPATRYFLGLRLAVNGELDQVRDSLPLFIQHLSPGGRLAIITFHSLEDRIVKHGMREFKEQCPPVNKKVIIADREEQSRNIRSRSAKLRVYLRPEETS